MQKSPGKTKFTKFRTSGFTKGQRRSKRGFLGKFASNIQEQTSNSKSRLFIVWGVLIAAGLGLGINLYNLQIIRAQS